MELVGRITKDAVIKQLKDERKVVNFSTAINDYYKPKNSDEGVKITSYVNCSYRSVEGLQKGLPKERLLKSMAVPTPMLTLVQIV